MYILGILCNNMQKEVALDIMGISYQIRNCLGGVFLCSKIALCAFGHVDHAHARLNFLKSVISVKLFKIFAVFPPF